MTRGMCRDSLERQSAARVIFSTFPKVRDPARISTLDQAVPREFDESLHYLTRKYRCLPLRIPFAMRFRHFLYPRPGGIASRANAKMAS